ncbi:hypothetical protein SASPL_148403 [Salvia splendens]|uniref:Transposase MuDR plant domain-containing protein n=1 Tax=Salvia splendens TaxID=180675 RepID=A0A8X8W9S5_SALSN|nr:hypothetical protein SASPL_148403 [Salvia splendens]
MSEKTFILSIHHGSRFVDDSRRRYVGGKVTQVCDALDIDKISYPEIISYVKEDLQYELESIDGLYYHKQGNFVLVKDDQAILSIVSELYKKTKLEFYVKHKNLAKEVTLSKQTEVIDRGVNQGVDLSDDNGSEDELLQQTFDNINKDIAFLTDDDDEEVKMSRKNIRSFKEKNTFNGKDNTRSDDELDAYVDDIICDSQEDDAQEEKDDELEEGNDSDGSFYYDSDDCCSYYSESDEECVDHALRKPSEMVRFDPMATIPVFCCGMIFQNVQECRDALAKYAIMKGLQIHYIKNDQVRVRAECMEKCSWKFLASKNSHNNDFVVKTYVPNHKCYRKNTNPMATSKSLSKLLKDRLWATPFIKYRDLKNLCKTELKLKISLTQARNIRKKVIADLLGSYTEEYKRLHDYVQEINSSNPGTTCVVKASKDEGGDINHFRCFYLREMNLLGNVILEDFMQYNVESFSKAYFRTTPKCDSVDNNMAETFNGWILDARFCVLHSEGLEPENFVAHWYIESTYLKAYQFMIQPVRGKNLWAETGKEEIAPPAHRKLPGRPKPGEDNVRSLEQYATNKSLSQSRNEMRDEQSSKRHNGSIQLGKKSRTTKSRMTKGSTNHPTGYGLYINENTGQAILNPGIRSNKYVKTHQETMFSRPSEDANKDVPGSKNQTTSEGLLGPMKTIFEIISLNSTIPGSWSLFKAIDLKYLKLKLCCKCKYNTNSFHSQSWCKSLCEVNSRLLSVPLRHKSGFML